MMLDAQTTSTSANLLPEDAPFPVEPPPTLSPTLVKIGWILAAPLLAVAVISPISYSAWGAIAWAPAIMVGTFLGGAALIALSRWRSHRRVNAVLRSFETEQ